MPGSYVPDRGDLVWLDFGPRAGHEQTGMRPALAISPLAYNRKVGLALFCPITSREKGYPFEVRISSETGIKGVVLSDQITSVDWRARKHRRAGRAPGSVVAEVLAKASALLA